MNKHVLSVLQTLSKKQFQLQNIRQLLCQEVEFSPSAAYNFIVRGNFSQSIDIYALIALLGEERDISALESVLKYYSNNDLELDLGYFQAMVLTKEDQLLKKLTKGRQCNENAAMPNYLVNYFKKLWFIEEELHSSLNLLKAQSNPQLVNILYSFKIGDSVDEQALKQAYINAIQHSCQQCPQISFELALRYLKVGSQTISFQKYISLFIPQNCSTIKQFLSNQEEAYLRCKAKPKQRDPYIHKQFNKLKKNAQNQHFCFREIQSVQTHLVRGKNQPSNASIKQKMISYSTKLVLQLHRYFKIIKKIIKLTIVVIETKEELIRSFDCSFGLLFKQIAQSQYLVPSQLQHYLNRIGINLRVEDLFIIFKKYGDPLTGKLTLNRFVNIFNGSVNQRKSLGSIDPTFRTASIACLLEQIKQQLKIQALKQKIVQQLQIRQVFDGLDPDRNGKLSRTDLEIVYKKITGNKLQERQVKVLWNRMGKSLNEFINYDTFMFEMLPKLKKKPKQQKTYASFRH